MNGLLSSLIRRNFVVVAKKQQTRLSNAVSTVLQATLSSSSFNDGRRQRNRRTTTTADRTTATTTTSTTSRTPPRNHHKPDGVRKSISETLASTLQGVSGGQHAASAPPPQLPENESQQHHEMALKDLVGKITQVQRLLDQLDPLPPVWSSSPITSPGYRRNKFGQARNLLARIKILIFKEGSVSPHKHQRELTFFFERLLQVFCETASSNQMYFKNTKAFEETLQILKLMSQLKLDGQHCDHAAVMVAARLGMWKEAAELFQSRIDPDAGNSPLDVSIAHPVGLFAIAKYSQIREHEEQEEVGVSTTTVERVLEGVLRMSMVSPTDQDSYLLAAGSALGHAGEWEGFVDYLRTGNNAKELGQPLVAAVMQACLLCDQHDQALEVFDSFVLSQNLAEAAEWHWGGGENHHLGSSHALCRDLAMRALGGSRKPNSSSRALEYYWSVMQEDSPVTLSLEALCGVVEACGREGKWEDAMCVLFSVLSKSFAACWLVPGDELSVAEVNPSVTFRPKFFPRMGTFLSGVMRACNNAGQFATALLAFWLLELSLPPSLFLNPLREPSSSSGENSSFVPQSDIVESFLPMIALLQDKDSLLSSVMVSLAGLSCPRESIALFDLVAGVDVVNLDAFSLARDVHEFVNRHDDPSLRDTCAPSSPSNSWPSVLSQLHRFTAAIQAAVDNEDSSICTVDARLLSSLLAANIMACSNASQPEAGLQLATWVDLHATSSDDPFLPFTDSLLASLIDAHSYAGRQEVGLELFSSVDSNALPTATRLLSFTAAIDALCRLGRNNDAMSLFELIVTERQSPDLLSAVASGLVQAGQWDSVTDVYRLALSSGCLSEELGLLAIKSVSAARVNGRFRVMRNIIEEVAAISGISPSSWIELKYWDLKRMIGFSDASRLMWWNDSRTRHLDELNFALQVFEMRALSRLKPNKDVLRLIVSAAKSFHISIIPENITDLPRLPRDKSSWVRTLQTVLNEARYSSLFQDVSFVEAAALAFVELGYAEEAIRILNEALERGYVRRSTLFTVVEAADNSTDSNAQLDALTMWTRKVLIPSNTDS